MTCMKLFKVLALNKGVVNISAFLEIAAILYQIRDSSITALLGNSKYLKASQASVPSLYHSFCACYLQRSVDSLLVKASFIRLSLRLKTAGFSVWEELQARQIVPDTIVPFLSENCFKWLSSSVKHDMPQLPCYQACLTDSAHVILQRRNSSCSPEALAAAGA